LLDRSWLGVVGDCTFKRLVALSEFAKSLELKLRGTGPSAGRDWEIVT